MRRRNFLLTSGLGLGATQLPGWVHRSLQPYDMVLLRRNVGYFFDRGGTIGWLASPGGRVVVDTQFPEQAGHLLAELQQRVAGPVDLLINTHHHGDHTSGNVVFRDIAKRVLAHENSKANQLRVAIANQKEGEQLLPDTTYTDRWQELIGDEIIDLQYWGPAHTNGDSIIHFQHANIVHCGDLMFNRRFPYIDRSSGARIDNWIEILQQLQMYFDRETIFIFGHARAGFPVTGSREDLAAFADYLTALLEFVGHARRAGQSREDLLTATGIPGAPEWSGDGIARSLNAAWEELEEGGD